MPCLAARSTCRSQSDASVDTSAAILPRQSPADVEVRNLYLETTLGPVDILSSIKGVGDYARVREGSIEIELFGRPCRVISVEDLIRAKESLARPKDVLAAQELRAILEQKK